jgi:glycosyltransferase involved in cell wall biosynthesis
MHILLIHQAFASLDEPGGTRHFEISRHLSEAGHKVTVIASPVSYLTGSAEVKKQQEYGDKGNFIVLRTYTYKALHKSFIHRLFSFFSFMISSFWAGLKVKDVDLVWGTSPPIFQGLTAWALARLKGAKFVFEVRDLWPAFAVAMGVLKSKTIIRMSEWLEKFLYRRADQIMINSPGFTEHIKGISNKPIDLIPNGADASMFNPDSKGVEFRKLYDLQDKFIVLYTGAHGMANDLGVVLEAAALLKDNDQVRIILVGDGKEKQNLIKHAKGLELNNLIFVPPVPKSEIADVIASADLCLAILQPIEMYKSVYPNKVFDYMASGRATLLAIDGVIRDVVETSNSGVFVHPGDPKALAEQIKQLASKPALVEQMGKNGRDHLLKHFDRPVTASQLQELFEKIYKN